MMKRPQSTRLGKRTKIDHLFKLDKTFLVNLSSPILPINRIKLSRRQPAKAVKTAPAERRRRPNFSVNSHNCRVWVENRSEGLSKIVGVRSVEQCEPPTRFICPFFKNFQLLGNWNQPVCPIGMKVTVEATSFRKRCWWNALASSSKFLR